MTHADTTESTPNKIAPPPSIQKMRVNNTLHQEGQGKCDRKLGQTEGTGGGLSGIGWTDKEGKQLWKLSQK